MLHSLADIVISIVPNLLCTAFGAFLTLFINHFTDFLKNRRERRSTRSLFLYSIKDYRRFANKSLPILPQLEWKNKTWEYSQFLVLKYYPKEYETFSSIRLLEPFIDSIPYPGGGETVDAVKLNAAIDDLISTVSNN